MKQKLALILALCMLLGALAGCSSTEVRSFSEDAASDETDPFAPALDAYAPDTVVMTINGTEVHWNEYAYWLCNAADSLTTYVGDVEDWSAVYDEDTGETYADLLDQMVLENLTEYHVWESKAAEYEIAFDEEGETFVDDTVAQAIQSVAGEDGTEADLETYLKGYYVDLEVFRYQSRIQYLYNELFNKLFGEDGEKLSDADLAAYIADNGYMTAKHILWSTAGDDGEALSDEAKAEKLPQAQDAVRQLRAVEDPAEREALFDTLMTEYSEDPGLASYPNGYCFSSGQMVEEFETACAALEDYAVSDPVESTHGYHVILRLPTTADDVVQYDSDGKAYTLRYVAALDAFDTLSGAWVEEAEVVREPEFETMDYNAVFTPKQSFWQKLFGTK